MASGSEKLRVGFLFDDTLDSNDGVAQYVKTLGEWLSAQGHEVAYLVGQTKLDSWAGGKVYSLSRNIPVIFNGNRLSIPLPAARRPIIKLLKANQFDVLHVMMPHSPFMSQIVINRAGPQTAIVGTFHIFPAGVVARGGTRALKYLYGRGLSRFDRVVGVSQAAADFARQSFGLETAVVPNMIDLKRFVPPKNSPARTADVLFLGRLVPRKGVRELLGAFASLIRRSPDLRLVIAGDGPQRSSLERFVAKQGLGGAVKFLGYIKESDKPGLLGGARIACFPSLGGEAFGIVLIEAMAAGAEVVIGGDNPGYRSVIGDRPELLVDARDTGLLAQRIESFLNDQVQAKRMHDWQQEHVKQYDTAIVGRQIVDIYYRAVAKRRQAGHN